MQLSESSAVGQCSFWAVQPLGSAAVGLGGGALANLGWVLHNRTINNLLLNCKFVPMGNTRVVGVSQNDHLSWETFNIAIPVNVRMYHIWPFIVAFLLEI